MEFEFKAFVERSFLFEGFWGGFFNSGSRGLLVDLGGFAVMADRKKID